VSLAGTVWIPVGPSPLLHGTREDNGLVTAIAVNSNNANVIYIGTAGGGVWRTSDGGANWTPLFDRQLSLGIGEYGAIAIDPSNTDIIYAGTSGRLIYRTFDFRETNTFQSAQAGLYKSTDGGASWILLGSGFPAANQGNSKNFANTSINVVLVDPADGRVYVASTVGVFVSTDGGLTVNQGVGLPVNQDVRSLVLDPSSPVGNRILYAGVTGFGVFQSKTGGASWAPILSGATAVLANALCPAPPCIPARGFGLFSVALAPPLASPNPNGVQVLYATMEGTPVAGLATDAPNPVGVFMSTDQGVNWTQRAATGALPTTTYGGYCLQIVVDPMSPGDGANDILYLGAIGQAVSVNSGTSFTALSFLHSDTHSWAFIPQPSPATNSIVLCGTDGGIASSANLGGAWKTLNSGSLQTGLMYNIDVSPDALGSINVAALQDNGLETTATAPGLAWKAGGSDGFAIAYDTIPKQVFGSTNVGTTGTQVLRSNDDGQTFPTVVTPWTVSDQGAYIAALATDPSNGGTVYALGSQNLWQSTNSGGLWRQVKTGLPGPGNSVAVAPTNPNNVVFTVGIQVFASTNALAATPNFTDITRDLPKRNVARAVFDPVDPTVVYVVLGGLNSVASGNGHVFRKTIAATTWTDISPPLDIPFSAIAVDGSDNPPTIYVGTEFGVLRSVDVGATWYVLDDLHLPHVPVLDLRIRNGHLRAGTYGRGMFAFNKPTGPALAVHLHHGLAFGTVCDGPFYLDLEVYNVGAQDLVINSLQRLIGSANFSVLPTPSTPVVVAPGEEIEFTVQYAPTAPGPLDQAVIRIASNDPGAPFVDVLATGQRGSPALVASIADTGDFGHVCVGSFSDEELTINNRGACQLTVTNITSTSPVFIPPLVSTFPLFVAPGASTEVTIRFQPNSPGPKNDILTIVSDDPSGNKILALRGDAPAPRLVLIFADTGNFGRVCIGSVVDKPLTLANSARCTLTVTNITSSSPDFLPSEVSSFPVIVGPGDALEVPIRFEPSTIGPHSATISVFSDDPLSPATLNVSGFTPSGKLAVTGSLCFGGIIACCPAERTIAICNVGECVLNVSSVAFKKKTKHWRLVNNPFPAALHPGSCLSVVVRYRADERVPRSAEIVITSDDPDQPTKTIEALAYTIWERRCKECCEDCKQGSCDKRHEECCCERCPPDYCCDEDDDEDR
jgi:photosystem II stability/assembly factor-like uncharacterized protein